MLPKRKGKIIKNRQEGEWWIMGEQKEVILTQEGYDKLEEDLN